MKYRINAKGVEVEVEMQTHDESQYKLVMNDALGLWKYIVDYAAPDVEKPGPAFGLHVDPRHATVPGFNWRMGEGKQPDVDA